MYTTRNITDEIIWVGCNDRRLERFENLFPLPFGVSYNSYLIMDEKVALMDTVDECVTDQFLENVEHTLQGRTIDYLVVHHMEPDHAANIVRMMKLYPQMTIVGNQKVKKLIEQFFTVDLTDRFMLIKEGDTLALGKHTLHFAMAPMVHWPEVFVSYEESTGALFTADAFGTFGTIDGGLFNDEVDFEADYLTEGRRYYANIVGKYGPQVQALLKKAAAMDVKMILPLHGPVWRSNLSYFIDKYDKWSRYEPEEKGFLVLYGSIYGHTAEAADLMASKLKERCDVPVKVYDVAKTPVSDLIGEIFCYSHLVFACATYNNGIFPKMADLLHDMAALNVQNRTVGIIQNGSWAPQTGKLIRAELDKMKKMTVLDEQVNIVSAMKAEQEHEMDLLADQLAATL